MSNDNIRSELDGDGILVATLDMPGRAMNVFSRGLMDALEALIARVESDPAIKGVVLTSGKPAFLAGADLDMIRVFTERAKTDSPAALHELCGHLGRLFRRLELSTKPYVAAINGLALGGGLEVCLACHERVVSNDAGVQLGLPEIKLGLLPGAGGTQRLPRLVGVAKGLAMLLSGEPLSPAEALACGLVHEVAPPEALIDTAKRRVRAIALPIQPWDLPGASFAEAPFDFSGSGVFDSIAAATGIATEQRRHYPAYEAIMDCVVGGWTLPMSEASHREMDIFVKLIRDPVAGNMVRTLFLNRQKAAKLGLLKPDSPLHAGDEALVPRLKCVGAKTLVLGLSEEETLLALALEAVRVWDAGKSDPPELADVAVVSAGLFPAYTGGPFTWLSQQGDQVLRTRAGKAASRSAELFSIPPGIAPYFARETAASA